MTEEKVILTIEKMLQMIGITDETYEKRMKDPKKSIGVATKANIDKVINAVKTKTFEYFGCEFHEVEDFDSKHFRRELKNFMGKMSARPEGMEIGSYRRGRKRRKKNCMFTLMLS